VLGLVVSSGFSRWAQRIVTGVLVCALLFVPFVAFPSVLKAQEYTPYTDVSVDTAYAMIRDGNSSNLVILDVRNQSEYDLGHLYGAVLIPRYQLEARICELVGNENHEIIVYCYGGSRSSIASGILAEHNFTKVYNMLGGILAWIHAGYPISTSCHLVTVDVAYDEILSQIEPLLLYESGCGCSATNTNVSASEANITVLEKTENRTVTLTTFEINGTLYEVTSASTLLWSDTDSTYESNKTIRLNSNQITVEGKSVQSYGLSYVVRNEEYNLTVYTTLEPVDSETYNNSFTTMYFVPSGETGVKSFEFVGFNCSVTLSQQYDVLSKVAKKMEKVYLKDEDNNLTTLASSYRDMSKEISHLSKFVRERLTQYDHLIIHSSALLQDMPCGPCGCYNDECGGGGSTCNAGCLLAAWLTCGMQLPEYEMACILGCALGAVACGPAYPVCVGFCWGGVCGMIGDAVMIACLVWAVWYCCFK